MPHFGDPAGLGEKLAGAVSVNTGGAAGVPVAPKDSGGLVAPLIDIDAGASSLLVGFRIVGAANDDVVASEALSTGFTSVQAGTGEPVILLFESACYRVDVVGIMNGTATGNCINHTDTAVNAAAQMVTRTFSEAVYKVVVSTLPGFNTDQESQIQVEGYKYA